MELIDEIAEDKDNFKKFYEQFAKNLKVLYYLYFSFIKLTSKYLFSSAYTRIPSTARSLPITFAITPPHLVRRQSASRTMSHE
jgi:HSP90 family molecular chaperone